METSGKLTSGYNDPALYPGTGSQLTPSATGTPGFGSTALSGFLGGALVFKPAHAVFIHAHKDIGGHDSLTYPIDQGVGDGRGHAAR